MKFSELISPVELRDARRRRMVESLNRGLLKDAERGYCYLSNCSGVRLESGWTEIYLAAGEIPEALEWLEAAGYQIEEEVLERYFQGGNTWIRVWKISGWL